jgi:hypothetical protein
VAFEEEKNATAASRVRDSAIFPAVDFPLLFVRARAFLFQYSYMT